MKKNIKNLFNLKNKIIVITGGSGFLGSEFSFALSDIGAIPVILDKNEKSLRILKKIGKNLKSMILIYGKNQLMVTCQVYLLQLNLWLSIC